MKVIFYVKIYEKKNFYNVFNRWLEDTKDDVHLRHRIRQFHSIVAFFFAAFG